MLKKQVMAMKARVTRARASSRHPLDIIEGEKTGGHHQNFVYFSIRQDLPKLPLGVFSSSTSLARCARSLGGGW